jgi:hypothetical protein
MQKNGELQELRQDVERLRNEYQRLATILDGLGGALGGAPANPSHG